MKQERWNLAQGIVKDQEADIMSGLFAEIVQKRHECNAVSQFYFPTHKINPVSRTRNKHFW